jgi:hypothetical protein
VTIVPALRCDWRVWRKYPSPTSPASCSPSSVGLTPKSKRLVSHLSEDAYERSSLRSGVVISVQPFDPLCAPSMLRRLRIRSPECGYSSTARSPSTALLGVDQPPCRRLSQRRIGNATPAIWESGGRLTIELEQQASAFIGIRPIRYSQLPRKLPGHVGASLCINSFGSGLSLRSRKYLRNAWQQTGAYGGWRGSGQRVPGSTSRTMAHQMSLAHKRRYVIFYGVSACAGCLDDVADRDMTAFAAEFKNLNR